MTIKLSPDQQDALDAVMIFLADPQPGEMAISGPAGTGKTVLTRFILDEARNNKALAMWKILLGTDTNTGELNVALTSSTNKAAKILSQATGEYSQTIHKLLGLIVKNDYSTGQTKVVKTKKTVVLENTFLIIDEASMINKQLYETIRECTHKCKVLYIGDSYQLPPVKEKLSPVFSLVQNQVKLSTIQRQVKGSPIISFAGKFRDAVDTNIFPKIESFGTEVQHLDKYDFKQELINHFSNPDNDPDYARVISWSNSRVHQYNSFIRGLHTNQIDYFEGEMLTTNRAVMSSGGNRIFMGDTVVKISNLKKTKILGIDCWKLIMTNSKGMSYVAYQPIEVEHVTALEKHFAKVKDWKAYFEVKETFVDLRPYFAGTIAKAQGSTYKNVFIDVGDIGRNTKNLEIARLMYTAITRASHKVFLRGDLPNRLYK